MWDGKKLYQSLSVFGSLGLALTIPWIVFKVCRAVGLKRNYQALMKKVGAALNVIT